MPEIPRTTLIKNFLNQNSTRPISNAEFMEFWKATTPEERDQFAREVLELETK